MRSGSYLQILTPKVWQIVIITKHSSVLPRQDNIPAAALETGKSSQTRIVSVSLQLCRNDVLSIPLLQQRNSPFPSNECCLPRHLWTDFSEGCLMVKSISSCLIRTAAGTASTLSARDSSQIFSAGKVWRSLLKHSSILKFGPLFSWPALKLHKGLFISWLMVVHIHQSHSTRRPLGEKWQRRHFASYVLPVSPSCIVARASVPHPWCAVGVQRVLFSSHTTTSAPGSCTNPSWCLNTGAESTRLTETCAGQTLRAHPTTTNGLVSPGVSLGRWDPLFLLSSYSLLWQRRWEITPPQGMCN